METLGSVASVVAAIRDEAAAEIEKLEKSTSEQLQSLTDAEKNEQINVGDRAARIAAAQRDVRELVAQQEWEARRALVEAREAWIARVRKEAHLRWTTDAGTKLRSVQLTALAEEALRRLPTDRCEIAVCATDLDALRRPGSREKTASDDAVNNWLRTLAEKTGKKEVTLSSQPAHIAGGSIVSASGVAVDNSFEERSRRLEPEWRRALCALYRS